MTQEQRERVEDALIGMIENVPGMNFKSENAPKSVSSKHMKAAAEVTYALIALHKTAPVKVWVNNTEQTPVREITIETPERKSAFLFRAEAPGLEGAVEKLNRISDELQRLFRNPEETPEGGNEE